MTADDVAEWKQKLLAPVQEKIRERAAAESAEPLRPDARIAVGHSRHGKELHLEIRVQRAAGPAWRRAEEARAKYPGEVNVAVLESVDVSPIQAVLEAKAYSPAVKGPPLRLGSSVGHRDEPAPGSLGAFVADADGQPAILSCSHVLGLAGLGKKRDPVFHPGRGDVKVHTNRHLIGHLGYTTVLSKGGANSVDAAYAVLDPEVEHLGNVVPAGVDAPADLAGRPIDFDPGFEPGGDAEVGKVGRTTGYRAAVLNAVALDNVPVVVPRVGLLYFDNCLEVRWHAVNQPFTRPGDSGALVFAVRERKALGIHFAAADVDRDGKTFRASYACELGAILAEDVLNLSWLGHP